MTRDDLIAAGWVPIKQNIRGVVHRWKKMFHLKDGSAMIVRVVSDKRAAEIEADPEGHYDKMLTRKSK